MTIRICFSFFTSTSTALQESAFVPFLNFHVQRMLSKKCSKLNFSYHFLLRFFIEFVTAHQVTFPHYEKCQRTLPCPLPPLFIVFTRLPLPCPLLRKQACHENLRCTLRGILSQVLAGFFAEGGGKTGVFGGLSGV